MTTSPLHPPGGLWDVVTNHAIAAARLGLALTTDTVTPGLEEAFIETRTLQEAARSDANISPQDPAWIAWPSRVLSEALEAETEATT